MSEHYFKMRQGDLEFEVRGDRDFVEGAVERWSNRVFNSPAVREPERGQDKAPIRVRKNISFQDFLKLKEPESLVDRLLTLAYFLEKYEGQSLYDLSQLNEAWHSAFPDEAFTPDIWHDALSRGYLEEQEGRLTLTFSGEAYVQGGLADQYGHYRY